MKRCSRCGEVKPLEDFPKRDRRQARDGRYSYCRPCSKTMSHARTRKWRRLNPEAARTASRLASRKLRAEQPDYFRNWYRQNADSERERSREIMRVLRRERPELSRATDARYRQNHPELVRERERANTHQRRALKAATARSILGGYSYRYMVDFIAELLTNPCDYCGGPGETLDHIVPLSRGGLHIPANLAPACLSCNSSKSNRLLHEWRGPPTRSLL